MKKEKGKRKKNEGKQKRRKKRKRERERGKTRSFRVHIVEINRIVDAAEVGLNTSHTLRKKLILTYITKIRICYFVQFLFNLWGVIFCLTVDEKPSDCVVC